jgi:hypothetical protein
MEGSLNMAQESSTKIRKQALIYQERIASLTSEVLLFVIDCFKQTINEGGPLPGGLMTPPTIPPALDQSQRI